MSNVVQLKTTSLKSRVSEAEWQARVDLAAAYRIVAHYGWTTLIYNHISARVPGTKDEFLINPLGYNYDEVTASSLVKINTDGKILLQPDHGLGINEFGFPIHSAVHMARHDLNCVAHTHSVAGEAVSASAGGLLPLSNTAYIVLGDLAYHEWEGPTDSLPERERLIAHLGDKSMCILKHHGLLAAGRTVGEAMRNLWFLEQACAVQVAILSSGRSELPTAEAAQKALANSTKRKNNRNKAEPDGGIEWRAILRKLDRMDPSYAT